MAENTMDAIKKKMQAMRLEKESAFDRADQLEQRLTEQRYIYDKVPIYSWDITNGYNYCSNGRFEVAPSGEWVRTVVRHLRDRQIDWLTDWQTPTLRDHISQ